MDSEENTADIIAANPERFNPLAAKIGFNPAGTHLNKMMTGNFIDYASYVIKDRAIPDVDDGLKPVQRRILHTLFKADDGKFHKVANIVGACMAYHPHGDSSIYGALVTIANNEYFIEKQGHFGNILTGDNASAARYIECRLSPLARETLFNPETTEFEDSYDGRNKEPICLPAKVPALLMMGTEGIAVGMATRILSHNFAELLKSQIKILRNQRFEIYPDFLCGGFMDTSQYDFGRGKITARARIDVLNNKTLVIKEIPPGTTTESLMNSIEDAAKNGKIKISSIQDYTAEQVEIEINLPRGVQAEWALNALYAFTQCEMSLSSNVTVIQNRRPAELHVGEVLHHNTQSLVNILRWELLNEQGKLNDKYHDRTLERIFIEERIYKKIEECESQPEVFTAVRGGLTPFIDQLRREIVDEDIERLLRIPIRRISLFDINKNNKELEEILKALEEVAYHLANLKNYAINFIKNLISKYGKLYPRKTEITSLEKVDAKEIAVANVKLGYDKVTGYIGTQVNGTNHIKCTEFDKIILVTKDGKMKITNVTDKLFVGRFSEIFIVDKEQVYSIVYTDKKSKLSYHKRCKINKFIVDKEYLICPKGSKLEMMETNYGIVLDCELEDTSRSKGVVAELIFDDVPIRSTTAKGFKTASRAITKFLKKKRGSEKNAPKQEDTNSDSDEGEEDNALSKNTWKGPKINFTQEDLDAAQIIADQIQLAPEAKTMQIEEAPNPEVIEARIAEAKVEKESLPEDAPKENKTQDVVITDTDVMGDDPTPFSRKIDPDSNFYLEP